LLHNKSQLHVDFRSHPNPLCYSPCLRKNLTCHYQGVFGNTHISAGLHSHYDLQLTPCLQLVLKGIKKTQSIMLPVRHCLPITLDITWRINSLLSCQPSHLHTMIYAACCLAFFTFLRISEFTVLGDNIFDKSCHLSFNSITIDNRDNPRHLKLTIKQSKTDPFHKGVCGYLGATNNTMCSLRGILPYLAMQGNQPGPLFIFEDGKSLTLQRFSTEHNNILQQLNLDRSFHIGAGKPTSLTLTSRCLVDGRAKPIYRTIRHRHKSWQRLSGYIISGYPQPETPNLHT